jgi:NADH-quinone oxidoreductase subunit K
VDYVILALVLLAIGVYGLLTKRDLLKVFVSVELIATAATMNFVMLVPSLGKGLGEAFLVLAFATDTCVSGVILALLVIVHKKYGTSNIGDLVIEESKKDEVEA